MARKVSFRLTVLGAKRHRKPGLVADGGGLYLQTGPGGAKSWVFRFRLRGGRIRAHGLGSVDTVTLDRARAEALRCGQLIREGIDPIEERRTRVGAVIASQAAAQSFQQAAEAYIAAHESGWSNAKHAAQWRSTLKAHAYPAIGPVPVAAVATAHVLAAIEPVWQTKPKTASRLRGRIEQVLNFAAARGLRAAGDNPARWRGHLDQCCRHAPRWHLSSITRRCLTRNCRHFAALTRQDGAAALALRFLILTCARTSEVIGATWDEFDLRRGLWILPPQRMKAGREWRVPLARRIAGDPGKPEAVNGPRLPGPEGRRRTFEYGAAAVDPSHGCRGGSARISQHVPRLGRRNAEPSARSVRARTGARGRQEGRTCLQALRSTRAAPRTRASVGRLRSVRDAVRCCRGLNRTE